MNTTYEVTGYNMSQDYYKQNVKVLRMLPKIMRQIHRGDTHKYKPEFFADVLIVFQSRPDKKLIDLYKEQDKIVVKNRDLHKMPTKYPEYFI